MLVISLFCTALLGLLQERTYKKYGPCWKEGVFYTVCSSSRFEFRILISITKHFLSLPIFVFLGSDIKQGIVSLGNSQSLSSNATSYLVLLVNLVSQLVCVSGVNRLSSVIKFYFLPQAYLTSINKLAASVLSLYEYCTYREKGVESLLQCLVVRKWMEYTASIWRLDGIYRQLFIHFK